MTRSKIWRIPKLHNLELLTGRGLTQSFPLHTHERYAVGVIEQGALGFFYRGQNVVASKGDINLCIPDEAHTGQPAVLEGWGYRMFYLEPATLEKIASDKADRRGELPFFQAGVIADSGLSQKLLRVHRRLENPDVSLLEQETILQDVLVRLIRGYADSDLPTKPIAAQSKAVRLLKDYLEQHFTEDVSLGRLARVVELNPYHLVHVFRQTVGIPPHAYLRQVRIRHAK